MTSSTDSLTTSFRPVVRETTVSGVVSTVSMRSALTTRVSPPNRVNSIIWRPPVGPGLPGPRPPAGAAASTPEAAAPPAAQMCSTLPPQVHQLLEHLVGGGDHPSVGLEAALGDDHVGEFLRQVHVGHLQRTGHDVAQAAGPRGAHHAGA